MPGETDWAGVWADRMRQHRESEEALPPRGIWDTPEAARRFWNMAHENGADRIRETLRWMPPLSGMRVLDVGAGPGALTLPIAKKASLVTAVEPSFGMATVLRENLTEEGIENALVVEKPWEEVDVEADLDAPYDIVFASFSLSVPDIADAVEKMAAASSRWVMVYWFLGDTSWDAHAWHLWPLLHGREFAPEPRADVIFNHLCSTGRSPSLVTFPFVHIARFSSEEEAAEHFAPQYRAETGEQKALLKEYLSPLLQPDGDTLILPGHSVRAKIWWRVDRD